MKINLKQFDIQKSVEKLLFIWVTLIIVAHLLFASFQYVFPYKEYTAYILWPSLFFFIAVGIYIVASLINASTRTHMTDILKKYFSFEQILLLVIFLWFMLSNYLNGKVHYGHPEMFFSILDWWIFDTFLCMFVLFPLPRILGKDKSKQLIELLIHIVAISYSVFTIYCLWHVFHLDVLDLPSGEQVGMTTDTQLMLGYHPNTTGMIAATMFCLCIYMVVTQDWLIKIPYIIFSVANLLVVYLSNSRTSFLAVVIFLAFIAFWLTWLALKDKNIFLKILLSLAVAAVIFIFFWKARTWTFLAFENITHFQEELASDMVAGTKSYSPSMLIASHNSHPTATALASTYGEGNTRNLDGLSGRENVWRTCIRIMTTDPFNFFFGVTPVAVSDSITTVGRFPKEIAHAHNSVLQIGVSVGVPMMATYILFLFQLAIKSIRILFSKTVKEFEIILPGFLLSFLFLNMAEAYLFSYFSIISCFFYLISGSVVVSNPARVTQPDGKKSAAILTIRSSFIYVCCIIALLSYSYRYININPLRIPGSGTKDDPYLIEDNFDLCYFRDLVNHGNVFKDFYFLQTNNIDLHGEEWVPIGIWESNNYFDGTYDGGCHVIENLVIRSNKKTNNRVGLFGCLGGTIQNLGIESGSVEGEFAGAFTAVSGETYEAAIINCYNKASITAKNRAGGICDILYGGEVINSLNEGVLSAPVTANLVSYDAKTVICGEQGANNVAQSFKGDFIPLSLTGDTIKDKLNSGIKELEQKKEFGQFDVRYWQ